MLALLCLSRRRILLPPSRFVNTFKLDITIRQRTTRKCYTLVHGIAEDIDLKMVLNCWKKRFNCSGSVKKEDSTKEEYIELFGDHREEVKEFLIYEGIGAKDSVFVHGAK